MSKQERLKSRKAIGELFRQGKSFAAHPLKAIYQLGELPLQGSDQTRPDAGSQKSAVPDPRNGLRQPPRRSGSTPLQAGFSASSRSFKKATDRNRIKRLMREAYRVNKLPLQSALLLANKSMTVFFIYTGKDLPDFGLVKQKMTALLDKLTKNIHAKPNAS